MHEMSVLCNKLMNCLHESGVIVPTTISISFGYLGNAFLNFIYSDQNRIV